MSSISKRHTKPTYHFVFSDTQQAAKFLAVANSYSKESIHPYDRDTHCKRNLNKVLVVGCGDFVSDSKMRNVLKAKAEELGGYYIPRA